MFDSPEFDGHESLHVFHDAAAGLRYVVAIHDTRLGPAIGGCRMWPYASTDAAIADALRLSRGMTYKAAFAGLPCGGGKSVVIGDPRVRKTPELLHAIGDRVESLCGRYTTSDDVGIEARDVTQIARRTRYACAPVMPDGRAAPATAYGTFQGIRATSMHVFGSDRLAGRRIAVQGLGVVGWQLCEYLHEAGAALTVADLDRSRVEAAVRRWDAHAVMTDEILSAEVDILAPCALGGILNARTIPRLRCAAVAGAANNQLATAGDAAALHARGIVYAPDYTLNVGGLVDLLHGLRPGYDVRASLAACGEIYGRVRDLLDEARAVDEAPVVVADRTVRQRLARGVAP
jgi:leucine dehydrogenase